MANRMNVGVQLYKFRRKRSKVMHYYLILIIVGQCGNYKAFKLFTFDMYGEIKRYYNGEKYDIVNPAKVSACFNRIINIILAKTVFL